MNQIQRTMEKAVNTAREAYRKAAEEYLAAVEATPDEMEAAHEIIISRLRYLCLSRHAAPRCLKLRREFGFHDSQ
jgi:hypothetical protein